MQNIKNTILFVVDSDKRECEKISSNITRNEGRTEQFYKKTFFKCYFDVLHGSKIAVKTMEGVYTAYKVSLYRKSTLSSVLFFYTSKSAPGL